MTMDDLRRRFAALDAVPMPDIRAEIDRRISMEPTRTDRVMTVRSTDVGRRALVLTPAVVVLLVGLLVTAVVGGTLVGAWLINRTPSVPLPPTETSPAPLSFDCAAAQASAAIQTDQWRSGPAVASPRAGWIAVWGGDVHPELLLVNPLTGATCSLITFSDFTAPPGVATPEGPAGWIPVRGPLAWSPDGSALAIVVSQDRPGPGRDALYVWSELGLAGPIIDVRFPSYLHVPSWSPDGSLLAIGESNGTILGPNNAASAWIIAGDGSAPREVRADCDACFGGSVYWSPSGDQIAFRTWTNQDNGESLGIAAGNVDDQLLPLLPSTSGGDALLGWATDASLWVALDTETEGGHLFEVPLDPRLDRVDHGFLPAGPGVSPVGVAFSPDGSQVLQFVERPRVFISDLMLADLATGGRERLVEGVLIGGPVWWSPDGKAIGYLVDIQTADQGIWLVNADGTGLRKLVGGPLVMGHAAYGSDATLWKVWQPRP
jgi:hypothetical protein